MEFSTQVPPDGQFFIITPCLCEEQALLCFEGRLEIRELDGLANLCLHAFQCEIHVEIDPRAIVFSSSMEIIYSPTRQPMEKFNLTHQAWLAGQKNWGTIPSWAADTIIGRVTHAMN